MRKVFIPLIVLIFVYLPFILNPSLFLERNNDLKEFFWPIFYFVKNQIILTRQIPLWNNLFFSGTPLLPDPQAPIFYLPNIIFLFSSIDTGFILSIILHGIIGFIGIYLAAKELGIDKSGGIAAATLYAASPKLFGFLEAGHFGLIASWAWIPFVLFFTLKIIKKPSVKLSIFLGLSLSLIFYSHVLIFLITITANTIFFLILLLLKRQDLLKKLKYFSFAYLTCFGLTAIALLPQLEWMNETTRPLLLKDRNVYPKWLSKTEFLNSIFFANLETEKIITFGIFQTILASAGFIKLRNSFKIIIGLTLLGITLFSLNNASPVYNLLIKQNFYVLLRVSTRIWFVAILIAIFLAGSGYELISKKSGIISKVVFILAVLESLLVGYQIISKPDIKNPNLATVQVYEFLSKDKDKFRVFCTTRCLSQKESALYNLELAEGYGTLQQKNYYEAFKQIAQSYWDRYTLSLPPFEIFLFEKLQPYTPALSEYSIKYVVSPHTLTDKNLKIVNVIDNFKIYENTIWRKKAGEAKIILFTPNKIAIENNGQSELVLSEIYNNGWKAFADGSEVKIYETDEGLRKVKLDPDTKRVEFIYSPDSFGVGSAVTFGALFFVLIYFIYNLKRNFGMRR